jgi:uncharacterized membrane protein
VYAFYVSAMSGFVIVIAPFGLVTVPSAAYLALSLLGAAAFVLALYCLYSALRHARASDVAPVAGAISALSTLALAWFLIDGDVGPRVLPAVFLLALGTALISHFHFHGHSLAYSFLAGGAFGVAIFLTKIVYNGIGFLDGFFWTRVLALFVALSLLTLPSLRRAILYGGARSSKRARALVVGNKILAGSAAALTAYAVSLGSVAIVNALAGLQFAFLFLFALIFAHYEPLKRSVGFAALFLV